MARDYALDPDPGPGGATVSSCGAPCPESGPVRIDLGAAELFCRCDLSRAVAACLAETADGRPSIAQLRRRLRAPLSCRGCRQIAATAVMEAVALSGGGSDGQTSPWPGSDATASDRATDRL